jgi:hypothetical protein
MPAFTAMIFGTGTTGTNGGCFSEFAKRANRGEEPLVTYFKYTEVQAVIARLPRPLVFAAPQLLVAEDYWRARKNADLLAEVHLGEKLGYQSADCHITDITSTIAHYIAALPQPGSLAPADRLFLFGGVIVFQDNFALSFETCMTSGCGIGRSAAEAANRFITTYRIKHRLTQEVVGYALSVREEHLDELDREYAYRLRRPNTLH